MTVSTIVIIAALYLSVFGILLSLYLHVRVLRELRTLQFELGRLKSDNIRFKEAAAHTVKECLSQSERDECRLKDMDEFDVAMNKIIVKQLEVYWKKKKE
jgi:hypothetical protein